MGFTDPLNASRGWSLFERLAQRARARASSQPVVASIPPSFTVGVSSVRLAEWSAESVAESVVIDPVAAGKRETRMPARTVATKLGLPMLSTAASCVVRPATSQIAREARRPGF